MVKMMIVDDEPILREYLRSHIDWHLYGIELCNEAKNGVDALKKVKKNTPDIILVDINMPFMDGIELSERLKKEYPEMLIIILTGHSEFEYARKAIRLGVIDFITKPFEKDELLKSVIKAKNKIQKEKQEKANLENHLHFVKEWLFNYLVSSDYTYDDEQTHTLLNNLGIRMISQKYLVSCIEIDKLYQNSEELKERLLWKFAISNILYEIVKTKGNHIIFNGPEERIISILEFDDGECHDIIIEAFEKLCCLVRQYFGFTITVGTGSMQIGFRGIRKSYLDALAALQNKFILGCDRVIEYNSLNLFGLRKGLYPAAINEDILLNLRLGNFNNVETKLKEVLSYLKSQKVTVEYAYAAFMGLISLLLSYMTECGYDIQSIFGKNFSPFYEIKNKDSINEAYNWVVNLFKKALKNSTNNKITRTRKIAEAAKNYIDTHYPDQDLNINKVASNVYVNPSYLRAIYKKEFGITINEYIVNVRMNKAREHLKAGNLKMSEIAELTGFSDASYFSKCFKKHFGVSPSGYEVISM
ncbi:MAG TPA: response regulator [Clostridiaceae bacterium]|nr:response regulator [Clostridiaceae bacterium]